MDRKSGFALVSLAVIAGSIAIAQPAKDAAPGAQPELPPGMSAEDMQKYMAAGTPGPMHEWLNEGCGYWVGQSKSWMAPDTEPAVGECTATVTSFMDGKFTRCEVAGEMPGMGPFSGFGIYGFDNVSKKFQSTWVDNFGTGMMVGTGKLSDDGKTLTWEFTYNCPITNKPCKMREIEKRTGKETYSLEMHGADPHTGVEFKMMEINFTRKPTPRPVTTTPGTR